MKHNRRIIGIVEARLVAAVNRLIFSILGEGYEDNFAVPLSPTGAEPATHFGGSAQMPEGLRNKVAGLMDPSRGVYGFPGWAEGVDDEKIAALVSDAKSLPSAKAGQRVVYTFDAACESLGLRRIVERPPGWEEIEKAAEEAAKPEEAKEAEIIK